MEQKAERDTSQMKPQAAQKPHAEVNLDSVQVKEGMMERLKKMLGFSTNQTQRAEKQDEEPKLTCAENTIGYLGEKILTNPRVEASIDKTVNRTIEKAMAKISEKQEEIVGLVTSIADQAIQPILQREKQKLLKNAGIVGGGAVVAAVVFRSRKVSADSIKKLLGY